MSGKLARIRGTKLSARGMELLTVITSGIARIKTDYLLVGKALSEFKAEHHYMVHGTWVTWCKEVLGVSDTHADDIIKNWSAVQSLPTNARVLGSKLPMTAIKTMRSVPPSEHPKLLETAAANVEASGNPVTAESLGKEVQYLSKKVTYGKKVQTPTHTSVSSYAPTFNERFSDEESVIGIVCPKCGHTFGSGPQLNGRDNDGFREN